MQRRFGEILREARKVCRLTLRDVGKLVELQPSYLSEVENGTRPAPKDQGKLKKMAKVLGVDYVELSESARLDQLAGSPQLLRKLFGANKELAPGFCRAIEHSSGDELNAALDAFMKVLNQKKEEANI